MSVPPITIFHVNGERGLRGGERQLLYLAAALRVRGHGNVICCRAGGALEQEARRQGFETLALPFLLEFDPLSGAALAKAARSRPRSIIHAHTGHAAGIALLARWFGGPPTVAHRRVSLPLRAMSRFKYIRMDRLVAVSQAIARVLEDHNLPREQIGVIYDAIPISSDEWRWVGIEDPALVPASPERRRQARLDLAHRFGITEEGPWIGNLAALTRDKDHRTLLAAAEIVARTHPNARFLIAGEGPEETSLRALIAASGLEGRVILIGHHDQPGQFLAALDLFVLSSQAEGLGSVLLEASACAVPVVATTAGGIPEVVQNRVTGLLAPPADPAALAGCLTTLLDDPRQARALARAAQSELSKYGLNRLADQTLDLYRTIL